MSMTAASEDPQAGSSQSQSTAASATLEVMDRLREINLSEAQVVTSPGESKQHETTITYGTEPAEACSSPRAAGGHEPGPLVAEPHDDKQLSPSLSMGDSPQAGEEAREMNNLFVGDLSRHCTEEQLRNTFAKYGEIVLVDIKRDKVSRNNLGYGFVQFKTHAQAAAAKEALNNTEICGRAVRLGWAQKNTTLFVGDLDGKTTTEQLRAAFSKLGPVVDDETFVAIGGKFGFVRYKYRPDAERAKVEMNGYVLGSKSIRIGWGDNNIQKHCVHIKFNGVEANGVSEGDFRAHFEQAGRVASVTLPRYIDGVYKGFGFIHFEDNDEGERAAGKSICTLTDTKVAGQVLVRCSYGKKPATKARASPGKQDRTFPASVRRREAPQYYDPYLMTEAYENQWSPYAPPSPQFYVHSNQSPATGTGVAHTMYVTEQTYYPPMYYTMVMHESPGKPVSPVPGSLEASPQLHVSPQLAHRSLPLHKAMHQSPQPGLRMLAPPSQVQVHQPPLQQYVAPPVPESYYPVQQPHPSMYPYRAVPAPTYVHGVSQPMLPSDKI